VNSIAALDDRASQLARGLESLESAIGSQAAVGARLNSLCEKLDQFTQGLSGRIDSQEEQVHVLRTEMKQPVGMVERILGALRNLDLRKETRFAVDEAVKVTVGGESGEAFSGRIVNASENGIGLSMEKPLPVGASIQVEVNNSILNGKILYSAAKGDRYALGVQLIQPLNAAAQPSVPAE